MKDEEYESHDDDENPLSEPVGASHEDVENALSGFEKGGTQYRDDSDDDLDIPEDEFDLKDPKEHDEDIRTDGGVQDSDIYELDGNLYEIRKNELKADGEVYERTQIIEIHEDEYESIRASKTVGKEAEEFIEKSGGFDDLCSDLKAKKLSSKNLDDLRILSGQ